MTRVGDWNVYRELLEELIAKRYRLTLSNKIDIQLFFSFFVFRVFNFRYAGTMDLTGKEELGLWNLKPLREASMLLSLLA